MSQHIGPRTISATGGSIKRVGNYRIHTFPSELVTDGLVLNLDAGDPRSYPSSGTTWTDLSGNGNNGTINSGSYDNSNGGSIVFNGISTAVSFPSTNIPLINRAVTLSVWFKTNSASGYQNIFDTLDNTSNIRIAINFPPSSNTLFAGFAIGTELTTSYTENIWYNLTLTGDNNIGTKLYLNGVLVNSSTTKNVPAILDLNAARLGNVDGDRASEWLDGNISAFHVYNRALSPAEVAQNYDALRVRYESYTSTFTPICAGGEGKVEVLCVAGGGGGASGGGGGGGLIYNSSFGINSNAQINVTVGSGGTSGNCDIRSGSAAIAGSNSTFDVLTSIGGGIGGQGGGVQTGGNGGSGGGAAANGAAANDGGTGTIGQGNNGGGNGGFTASPFGVGGGGGAGSVGVTATSARAFPGGSGLSYSISGESKFYAGGGGGGAYYGSLNGIGGSGVGGDGAKDAGLGINAIPNTGSGGGGGSATKLGGNGANGTVIVRYPATDYNVEVLVVGGGGGGGYSSGSGGAGGGGGAGGLLYYSSYPVSAGTKYSVTVGAGGAAATYSGNSNNDAGKNGNNSIFGSVVAYGGGGGGPGYNSPYLEGSNGRSGGSGGGGGSNAGIRPGGSGILGQGNNGGAGADGSGADGAGGGGGAGSVGQDGTGAEATSYGGNGGIGVAYSITGTSTYYAGGGGGGGNASNGIGGLGGGAAAGDPGGNGTANTGGGGGGAQYSFATTAPGSGGSGIVIIAYKGPQRGIGGTVDTTSRPGYTLHKFTAVGTDFFIP